MSRGFVVVAGGHATRPLLLIKEPGQTWPGFLFYLAFE